MSELLSAPEYKRMLQEVQECRDLLTIAYWWHKGLRHQAPERVRNHPMWPANNDRFHESSCKGPLATANPGTDRLWEAIAAQFGVHYDK